MVIKKESLKDACFQSSGRPRKNFPLSEMFSRRYMHILRKY